MFYSDCEEDWKKALRRFTQTARASEYDLLTIQDDDGRWTTFHIQESGDGKAPTDRCKSWHTRLRTWWREKTEDCLPFAKYVLIRLVPMVLTVAIAVAVIICGSTLVGKSDTWGSALDFLTAFTWGAVAKSTAEPVQSGLERLRQALAGAWQETAPASAPQDHGWQHKAASWCRL